MGNLYHIFSLKKHIKWLASYCITVLVIALCNTPSFSASAQTMNTVRVSFAAKNQSIKSVFRIIEQKTSFRIGYNSTSFDADRTVTITANNELVIDVLKNLIKGYQGNIRQVDDEHILLQIEKQQPVVKTKEKELVVRANITVTGKVTDESGEALIGVSVAEKGTSNGTMTNTEGKYSLSTDENSILVFKYIGYDSQEIPVKAQQNIDVVLKANSQSLKEVVVIGYGTQSRSTLSGAVSTVGLDKLTSRSFNNLQEALQGKAAGVVVNNNGGDPTNAPQVNIRGLGGINGEQPLYVIDGSVFYPGTPVINPSDVESISVLKDASAAIYGARASGGVILITTKKGTKGKMNISFDAKQGFADAWKKLEALNAKEYADVYNTAADNAGKPRLPAFDATKYPDGQITRTNWVDEIFRTGHTQDYNVSLNGGNDKSDYFMSFNYRKGTGILLNTYSERYAYRINSTHQVNNWLKVGENLSYTYSNGRGTNTFSGYTGAIQAAIFYPPSITPRTPSGIYSGLPITYAGSYGDVVNPVANLERIDTSNPVNTIIANPYFEADIIKGLKFRSNYSITKNFYYFKGFSPIVPEVGKPSLTNTLSESSSQDTRFLTEQTLNYKKSLGKNNLDVVAGYTYQKNSSMGLSASLSGFSNEDPLFRYFINGTGTPVPKPGDYKSDEALISYLARVNYDYDGKYLLSFTGRRDGTSLVAPKNRFQNFGSVSGGWVVSRENFMQQVTWLSNLKIRGSYGVLGNLSSVSTTAVSPNLSVGNIYLGSDPAQLNGYYSYDRANPDLTWARSKQTDIGLDLGFLNERITLTADYFIKKTENMLMNIPAGIGLGNVWVNGGEARDNGIEFSLGYNSDPKKAFHYGINANVSTLTNKLLSLPNGNTTIPGVSPSVRGLLAPAWVQVGQPLYSYYSIKTNGLFQSQAEVDSYKGPNGTLIQPNAKPGDIRFVDANGDGKIDDNDRQFLGSAYPKFTYGLSLNASYKGFDLNIFLQGVQGNKLYNALKYTSLNAGGLGQNYNLLKDVLNAWTPQHTNTTIPRVTASDNNGNFGTNSDFYIENGSYLRFKNVTLGYTFSPTLLTRAGISSLRIYATSNNLFTITKYKGFDPEVGFDNYGIDVGRYPQSRSFIFGINLNL
ncbi:SusC/RagA family TonB-linked outer membrane protein [Mucilaginibacter aquaedulcis]|uniref:SusC/RagA family TonB-linked outer membrane protein n=1 Tax=Mucilaginibacter aquaedulcis TaxID=1187081 RepID=UPI0025B43C52|nr:TonB-dependent receptor [Mucilaginibacter aquaedulcis]MDN3547303.1 TonB-dependent receptor [Mucilaginibacter aquaedulcis]